MIYRIEILNHPRNHRRKTHKYDLAPIALRDIFEFSEALVRYSVRQRHRAAENSGIQNKYLSICAYLNLNQRKALIHSSYYIYATFVN